MATYEISAPDGHTYRIDGPDGATQEQIQNEVMRQNPHLAAAAPASPAPAPAAKPEAGSRSWGDTALEAVSNLPGSAANLVGGVVHAVAHPLDTARGAVDLLEGGARNLAAKSPMAQSVVDWLDRLHVDPEVRARAIATANAVGGAYKAKYGSEEGLKNAIATDPAGVAADLSMLLGGAGAALKAGGAVGTGARVAAAADAANPMTYVARGAQRVAAPVANAVGNTLAPVLTGAKNNFFLSAVENRGPEVVNALRNPDATIVPGSLPTAGEAAAPAGATRLSAAQKAAEAVLPTEYFDRAAVNRTARQAALETVSGSPGAIPVAEGVRAGTASDLYGAAFKEKVKGDAELKSLMSRPSMDVALARAAKIAAERKKPFTLGEDAPEQIVPSAIVDTSGAPVRTTVIPAKSKEYPVQSLHYVKMALDDMVKDPAQFGIGSAEVSAIRDTRAAFTDWLGKKTPKYGEARATYARQSEPINAMQVGEFLKNRLAAPIGEGERASAFATAMDEAPRTIKRATGQARFQKLDEVLTPNQVDAVNAVRDDLERGKLFSDQAKAASSSDPNIRTPASSLLAEATGGIALPNMMSRVTAVANAIVKRVQGKIDHKLAIEIAADMLDPAKTATNIENAMARAKTLDARGNALRAGGRYTMNALASKGALASGQLDNALAPQ